MMSMKIFLSLGSSLVGVALFGSAIQSHDLATGFTGVSSVAVGILLYQFSDLKERIMRIEQHIFDEKRKAAKHS